MDTLLPDPNPILDEGAPTSTGGIENAATLCDILGIPLNLDPPRERYYHGWGDGCYGAKMVVCSWTLTVHDTTGKPTALTFDLVPGSSPLIIGMDIRAHCDTFNRDKQKYVRMKRPSDAEERILFTYLVPDDNRLRLDIVPHPRSATRTLLGNIHTTAKRTPLAFCKRVHRYTHATPDEIRRLCKDANMMTDELEQAIVKVFTACEICTKNGRPKPSRKVSLTHVNEEFNQELQMDFFYSEIKGKRRTVMNITDTGTAFTELSIADDRTMKTIIRTIESIWIHSHGAPVAVSADDEYNRAPLKNYLSAHGIEFKPRPDRRHNKLGIVERKNGTVKTILRKLDDEISDADATTIVSRAAFLSNMFSGNRILSSFELVRGYSLAVIGIPKTMVSEAILVAHKEQVATRTLQRLLHSRAPDTVKKDLFNPGDPVWVFYNTSKQNERVEWIRAKVVSTEDHALVARRSARGPPMIVAYEDVRFAPRGELTTELLACSLEDEMGKPLTDTAKVQDNPSDSSDEPRRSLRLRFKLKPPDQNQEQGTLLATDATQTNRANWGEKDIGSYAKQQENNPDTCKSLTRDTSRSLDEIHNIIGSKQVTASHLSFAPPWILREALKSEHDTNWHDAYKEVMDKDVPRTANVITSHVVYKLKTDEQGARMMKVRIVPHGNHDDEKDDLRKDSSNASLFVVRLMLSLVTFLGFRIGTADIKGAFLQSGPITRDIYVRPPREWMSVRGYFGSFLRYPMV